MSRSLVTLSAVALALGLCAATSGAQAKETRCGWYVNPTPGNYYLTDRDASWWMRAQGGRVADGFDENAPEFDPNEYVELQPNGYGYGCACLSVETNAADETITRIYSGRILPLAQCHDDAALPPAPDDM
jgi:hypothetical protein